MRVKRKPKLRPRMEGPLHGLIKSLRIARGLTQQQLATKLGVDKTAVSHWENGIAQPALSRLPDLAKVLGVKVDKLIAAMMQRSALMERAA